MIARSLKIALSTAALLISAGASAQTAASPPPFNFMNHTHEDETISNGSASASPTERGGMRHRISGERHRRHMIQQ